MTTLEALRRRLETASDLGAVVSTMKTLAAVSIRQYETAVAALADYESTLELGFQAALRGAEWSETAGEAAGKTTDGRVIAGQSVDSTVGPARPVPTSSAPSSTVPTGIVLFGSDQGLCGAFNERIVEHLLMEQAADHAGAGWRLLVVGGRAESRLLDARRNIDHRFQVPSSVSDITNLVLELLPCIEHWRDSAGLGRLLVFHHLRTSPATSEPRKLQLLPFDLARLRRWRRAPWPSRSLPMLASDRERLLSRLVRQHLFVSLFRACAESLASENASRLAAMQAAERNIEERLAELRGAANLLRQDEITAELLEIVTGFEALERSRPHGSR